MNLETVVNKNDIELVKKWEDWVKGEKGKNWACLIEGQHKVYKLQRKFLDKERYGREKLYKADDFVIGQIYQFCSAIKAEFTDDYEDEIIMKGYFKCIKKEAGWVRFREMDEDKVIELMENPELKQLDLAENYLKSAVKLIGKDRVIHLLEKL